MKGLWRWAIRLACSAVVLGCSLLVGGFIYEKIGEARDLQKYLAPGKMVDVGGRKLHLYCKGEGGPTVVIETGAAVPSYLWWPIQNSAAKFTRACTYDRPGFGWSEPSPSPLSMSEQGTELHTLLTNAGISGPYVLLGHSYGGALCRLFTRAHPDQVAGLVLVESTEEEFIFSTGLLEVMHEHERTTRTSELEARFGLIRFQLRNDPVEAAAFLRPEYYRECLAEEDSLVTAPAEMRSPGGFGKLGNLPLVVVRRGVKLSQSEVIGTGMSVAQVEQRWKEGQERVAGLSTDSELIVANKSGHNVNVEQPGIIVDAIARVVAAVRHHISLSQDVGTSESSSNSSR